MGKKIDLTGHRFGKWTVIGLGISPHGYEHQQFWLCRCECGAEAVRKGGQLRHAEKRGVFQSCQSCGAKRHGYTGTSTHRIWIQMRDRCRRQEHPAYARYGGRGITVCERWQSFENFLADMGERPAGHSLDRIDNDKGYSPENCRWATRTEQNRNKTGTRLLTFMNKTMTVTEWESETGIPRGTIYVRVNTLKWSVERALTTPVGAANRWSKHTSHVSS